MQCQVIVDTFRCNGCGSCVEICPEVFRMNDDTEKADAIEDTVECSEDLELAAVMCPVDCIEIEK